MHVFKKKVPLSSFYIAYVNIINGLLRLSKKECEVFSLMLAECKNADTNGTITKGVKDVVAKAARLTAPNMSRSIRLLLNRGAIIKAPNGDLKISKVLIPTIEDNTCSVTYTLSIVDDVITKDDENK